MNAGNRFFRIIAAATVVLLACAHVQAEPLHFLVANAAGEALENAVIMGPPAAVATPADVAIMDQVNKTFQPHVLVVEQGQQVLFPNSDNIRHHVYSFSPAKPFEIKLYAGIPEKPLTFDNPGIVVLGCNIHDSMLGYIVVADSPAAGKSGPDGKITLDLPAATTTIRIWHPYLKNVMTPLTMPLPEPDASGLRTITLNVVAPAPRDTGATFGNRFKRYGR